MKDVYYKYPSRQINTLNQISVQVSMASRVAVIGVNGAGKSTLIKLMVGEIEPNLGEGEPTIARHPNMRLAYVAQVWVNPSFRSPAPCSRPFLDPNTALPWTHKRALGFPRPS